MASTADAEMASAAAGDAVASDPAFLRWTARLLTGAVVVLVLLVVVEALRAGWTATSDEAWEVLRMHDVGTRDHPLLGVYSRFGFNHPGPALFWVGAPGWRIAGDAGVLAAIGVTNLLWFLASVRAARHLGGRSLMIAVTAVSAAMIATAGPVHLVSPWNPWATTFSTLCLILCAFAFAERGIGWCAPVAVLAGSFAVQAHVGTAPVVLTAMVIGAVWFWRVRPPVSRPLVAILGSAIAFIALWIGPIVQQLRGPDGNLAALLRFSREGAPGGSTGFGDALASAATELGPLPAWMGFAESDRGLVAHSPAIGLIVLPLLLAVIARSARRRHPLLVRSSLAGIGLHLVSVLAIGRVTGGLYPYVIRWVWAPAAVVFVFTVWALVEWSAGPGVPAESPERSEGPVGSAGSASGSRFATSPIRAGFVLVAAVWTIFAVGATAVATRREPPVPAPALGERAAALASELDPLLPPGPVHVTWGYGEILGAVPIGAIVQLITDGADLRFDADFASAVGERRVEVPPGTPSVHLVPFYDRPPVPAGHRLLGSWDPLDLGRRAEYVALDRELRTALELTLTERMPDALPGPLPGPSQGDLDRWHELRAAGAGYGILLVDPGP